MEKTILIMLIVIALLICAIAGLIIKISGQAQKIKTVEATNKTLYKIYQGEVEKREIADGKAENLRKQVSQLSTIITKQNKKIDSLEADLEDIIKRYVKKNTTADFKEQIIKDYRAGADVHDIATKYSLKANTVFKAIARRKAKGEI